MHKLFDPILTSLYRSPLQPSYWQLTLDQICEEFHARSAVLSAFSMPSLQVDNWDWSTRDSLSLEKKEQYDTYMLSSKNPRARVSSQKIPALISNDCISIRDKDLFKEDKQGLQQIKLMLDRLELGPFLGTGMSMGGGRFITLALHRAKGNSKEFSVKEERAIHELMPHLRQSLKLSHRLNQQSQKITGLESIINQCRLGVVMYSSSEKQYYPANDAAKRMLDGRYGLCIEGGKLLAESSLDTDKLYRQISLASAKDNIFNQKPHYFINLGGNKSQSLKVQIQAIDQSVLANQLIDEGISHQPSVMLLLSDDDSLVAPKPEKLVQLFGLSPAEAKLVSYLCRGVSLNHYAQHRGIAVTTARYQLKQAFSKTNTSSQVELLLLVISSITAHWLNN